MSKHKHLTMEDRQRIMQKLNAECSFRKIAKDLGKSPTTISQEVKRTVPFNAPAPMDGRITPVAIGGTAKKDCFAENCTARK